MRMLDNFRKILNERRARDAIDVAQPALARTVAGMEMAERAAVMIIAHAMLRDATQDYGMAVIANPSKLRKEKVAEFLTRLGRAHRRLTASLDAVSEHVAGDLVYAGVLRQIRATEVVIVTVGMAFDRTLVAVVKQTWRGLWQARTHAVDGVRRIQSFERAMHERALPASQPKDPEKMARLATRLPEMFKPVSQAGKSKTTVGGRASTGSVSGKAK
jgi:FAD/FMN-containing dehydrogenase